MKSKDLRQSPELLRNEYPTTENGFPIIQLQEIPAIDYMLSFHNTRKPDKRAIEAEYLIHFFKDDVRFDRFYDRAYMERTQQKLKEFAQYSAICTPDFSLYPEMPLPVQKIQVFKNRWCGAYWQSLGLCVVPTITWGDGRSYPFCFDGVALNGVVAISTVGCQAFKRSFLDGYYAMVEAIHPSLIYCYGTPFSEIAADVIAFPYEAFKRGE